MSAYQAQGSSPLAFIPYALRISLQPYLSTGMPTCDLDVDWMGKRSAGCGKDVETWTESLFPSRLGLAVCLLNQVGLDLLDLQQPLPLFLKQVVYLLVQVADFHLRLEVHL